MKRRINYMKNLVFLSTVIIYTNLLFSQAGYYPDYGPSDEWAVTTSTSSGFIIFDNITLNGENVEYGLPDDSPTGICPDMNCDILAAMYNNIPVGWTYIAVSNNVITISVQLNDGITDQCVDYPQFVAGVIEPIITFHFYDASEQKLYYNVFSSPVESMGFQSAGILDIEGDGAFSSGFYFLGTWTPYPLGVYDEGEVFIDSLNGYWNEGEEFTDALNGVYDEAEEFTDENGNNVYDVGEEFTDENGNNVWDVGEEFTDENGNNVWDEGEVFIDALNGVYDEGEEFTDALNGVWDEYEGFNAEDFTDEPVCPLSYADNFSAFGGSGDESVCDLEFFTCGDETACNYSEILNTCNGGIGDCSSNLDCQYPEENFDCDGSCIAIDGEETELDENGNDCAGDCGGNAYLDCNDICSNNEEFIGNIGELNEYGLDCAGNCDGNAEILTYYLDFDGDGWGSETDSLFCNATVDAGWVINSNDEDDTVFCESNELDCAGNCDGDAYYDCYGICSNDEEFIGNIGELNEYGLDCAGNCDGNAEILTYYFDSDGDGWGSETDSLFCNATVDAGWVINSNDEDDTVFCESNELDCAGNCDGNAEILTYYLDFDGDGWGSETDSLFCNASVDAGWVINSNDEDDSIFCESNELDCTGICDGDAEILTYYFDSDGDGWGSETDSLFCNATVDAGWVINSNDEDDTVFCESNELDCTGLLCGTAFIDSCGECVETEEDACACDAWQKDCEGNCPGITYLGNNLDLQYNISSEQLNEYILNDNDTLYLNDAYFLGVYGENWQDENSYTISAIGYDCNGVCNGDNLVDCSDSCVPQGTNEEVQDCADSYLDQDGNEIDPGCESFLISESDMYCCPSEFVDCNNVCYGDFELDDNSSCCAASDLGCDNICNSGLNFDSCGNCAGDCIANENGFVSCGDISINMANAILAGCDGNCDSGLEFDSCGNCAGDCIANENGFVSCGDISINMENAILADCAGECGGIGVNQQCGCGAPGEFGIPDGACDCDGNTLIETYYYDSDQDSLGSDVSADFCSAYVPENWVSNSDDIDDDIYCESNQLDCAGVLCGNAIEDCLGNCEYDDNYIGGSEIPNDQNIENYLDLNGFDCNEVCGGSAYIDACGQCVGGDSGEDACECDDWQKDCEGNCPGITYLGNNPDLQYNISSEQLSEYILIDSGGNTYLDTSYFINVYGDGWMNQNDYTSSSIGYDCAGNCQGEAYLDCQDMCSNDLDFIGYTGYLDKYGNDCQGTCDGNYYEDICGECHPEFDLTSTLINIGYCYLNGESTGIECSFDENGYSCEEGYCYIVGEDTDECGECLLEGEISNNNCVYYIDLTAATDRPDISIGWNSIQSEEEVMYHIFRDNIPIAQTADNVYEDISLEFDTQYCYNISVQIGDEHIPYINERAECEMTTNITPNYILSVPAIMDTPPNYPIDMPIKLVGENAVPIVEMIITVNYDSQVFIPDTVIGIGSFSSDNYDLTFEIEDNSVITIEITTDESSAVAVSNEEVIIISGFSGNGSIPSGTITLSAENLLPVMSFIYYGGEIEISDFYLSILGSIDYYSNNLKTPNVDVKFEGRTSLDYNYGGEDITDYSGEFAFYGILPGSYDVIPSKNNEMLLDLGGELSSTDASQIARNSVGLFEFDDYQVLAADVTLNGDVSGLDASKVARYRIGQITELNESNTHWIFYPDIWDVEDLMKNAIDNDNSLITANCSFDPNFAENVCTEGPRKDMSCNTVMINSPECPLFYSIRLGDVTGNWSPSQTVSSISSRNDPIEFIIEDESFSLPIRILEDTELQGVDITIEFDNNLLQLENITFIENQLNELGYSLMYNQNGTDIIISSFATTNLGYVQDFINLDFSLIDNSINNTNIEIKQFFINEMESESGFEITDSDGNLSITKNIYLNFTELSNQVVDVPEIFDFRQNYPNPFNPITEISFDLPIGVNVDIDIYDIKGNKVHDLIKDIYFNAGRHNITWNASNHPGGIYFYRITAGEFSKTHKMILLK